jgi:hypothetical protein
MQITLKQDELETAVRSYIASMGLNFHVSDVSFTSSRGGNGVAGTITTEVEVGAATDAPAPTNPILKAVDSVVEKVAEVVEDVVETVTGNTNETPDKAEEEEVPTGKSLFS